MNELYKETILSVIITELATFEDVTEKEFILKYDICGLYDKEGHDYLTVLNHKTGQMEKFEIICTIDLTKKDLVNIELFPVFN